MALCMAPAASESPGLRGRSLDGQDPKPDAENRQICPATLPAPLLAASPALASCAHESDDHSSSSAYSVDHRASPSVRHGGGPSIRWGVGSIGIGAFEGLGSSSNSRSSSGQTSRSQTSSSGMSWSEVRAWVASPGPLPPPAPASFRCPCCGKAMADPVLLADGTTLERACIASLFEAGVRISPVTGKPLESLALFPDVALRAAIRDYTALRNYVKQARTRRFYELYGVEVSFDREIMEKERSIRLLRSAPHAGHSPANYDERGSSGSAAEELAAVPEPQPLRPLVEEAAAPHAKITFSSGAAPRRLLSSVDMKVMRQLQKQEMVGKGSWWARILCR